MNYINKYKCGEIMKSMDICLISDSNYAIYMATTIVSILKNSNSDEIITFHIIDGGILQTDKDKLISLKEIRNFNILFYTVDDNITNKYQEIVKIKTKIEYYTPAIFYVLELHNILKSLDKVLYLDCDIIVNRSLYELYNTDINNYSMAVSDRPEREEYARIHFERIKLKDFDISKHTYFNSGVLLINLKYWRENSVSNLFLEYINNNDFIELADQEILNYVFVNNVKFMDYRYNFLCEKIAAIYYKDTENPYICHYTNGLKSIKDYSYKEYNFLDEYWKYFLLTPYFKENPYQYINTIIYQKIKINERPNLNVSEIYQLNNKIDKLINTLAWFIPIRKWRDNFRNKFKIAEQSRAEQSRAEQSMYNI